MCIRDRFRRLKAIAGSRMTREGVVVLTAHSHRSQDLNRQDARARLAEMIRQALVAPKFRVPTRPTLAAKGRRLTAKKVRGEIKQGRGKFRPDD